MLEYIEAFLVQLISFCASACKSLPSLSSCLSLKRWLRSPAWTMGKMN